MSTVPSPEDPQAEIERLRAEVAALTAERRDVATANVRAAMQLVELSEQRRVDAEERERMLQAALTAAESASREKDVFLAKVSHELRTPLNGVIGMTTLLLDTTLSLAQRECAESALSSARNLLELIQDILDVSKIEASRLELESCEFDLWQAAEEVVRALAPRARSKGLEFGLAIAPQTPRYVLGDAVRLRQVLANLCSNAVKFTDVGAVTVSIDVVRSTNEQATVRFEVVDSGCGIPDFALPKLFRAFSQVDDSIRRRHDGTGLGLAISQSIVRLLGGELCVQSTLGAGSVFHFEWTTTVCGAPFEASSRMDAVAYVVGAAPLTRRVLEPHLRQAGARVTMLPGFAELELALGTADVEPDWVFVEVDAEHVREPREDLVERCSKLAGTCRVALLTPIDDGADVPDIEGIAAFALPLRPSRVADWLSGKCPLNGKSSSLRDARTALSGSGDVPTRRVLLVEDNRINQRVACGMLRRLGCEVELAEDGAEALSRLKERSFDLVLMDCQMPRVDGFEATRRHRDAERASGRARLPIIALTAQVMSGDRERCLEAGMDDYLSKPIDPHELSRMLQHWATVRSEARGASVEPASRR